MTEDRFTAVSGWVVGRGVGRFVMAHRDVNRFYLLVLPCSYNICFSLMVARPSIVEWGRRRWLIYVHGQEIIHGDLGGMCLLKQQQHPPFMIFVL